MHTSLFSDILEVSSHIFSLIPQDRGPPARRLENQNPVHPSRTLAARCCLFYATVHTWEIAKMPWRFRKLYISIVFPSMVFWIFCMLSHVSAYLAVSRTFPGDEVRMWRCCYVFLCVFSLGQLGEENSKRYHLKKLAIFIDVHLILKCSLWDIWALSKRTMKVAVGR